jgi:hypothetical protein
LQTLDTKHGKQEVYYRSETPTVYHAELTQTDVDGRVTELEAEIDRLQEELDKYNYNTEVELPETPTV